MYVNFYFFWKNQSDYLAVINADSDLGLRALFRQVQRRDFFRAEVVVCSYLPFSPSSLDA